MSEELHAWIVVAALVVCRVGASVAVLPFLSAARISPSIRAYFALALSMALVPMVHGRVADTVRTLDDGQLLAGMASEILTGFALGFVVRLFFLALNFAGVFIANLAGFAASFGPSVHEDEPTIALADLMTMFFVILFVLADMHLVVIDALIKSFDLYPVTGGLSAFDSLDRVRQSASASFLLALQFSAPFVVFAVVTNVLLGLASRLVPQVPIQLVSAPMIVLGALGLCYLVTAISTELFLTSVSKWLE